MVDRAEAERTRAHRDHVDWLQGQHAELQEHRELSMRDEDEDFAVGSDVAAFQFEACASFSVTDEDTRYRSLDMTELEQGADAEVHDEALVYRSMPIPPSLARSQSSQSSSGRTSEADASWLAAGRPPLLQRQNAFIARGSDADAWLSLER